LGSKARPSAPRPRAQPRLEALEDRLVPAVQLTYGGPGSVLSLQERVSGATPAVTISEPAPNQLKIDLGAQTFHPTSTAQAPGLTYENAGSPGTSHFATLYIGRANNITTLQATLAGDMLTLGVIANGSVGLGNVAASADVITVTGLDTSHAGAGNGNVDLRAAGPLTVAPGALLDTGTGTLALAADVNADGTGNSNTAALFIASGATVVSANSGRDAITLRGADIAIDTSSANPGVVGGRRDALPTTPSATLTGLNGPWALAFDADGNLYVANSGLNDPATTVSVFAPDGTRKDPLTGLYTPEALAFDADGNLYVANSVIGTVSVFAPGSKTPTATLTGLNDPTALALDSHGNLYVANAGALNDPGTTVSVFAPDGTPKEPLTGLNGPSALAFDSLGNLYVANQGNGSNGTTVSVFAPGSKTPTATLSGLNEPRALAFDSLGNLYVANAGNGFSGTTVSVFDPDGTPKEPLTGLNGPNALAFDALGNLFVANSIGTTVSVFAPGSKTPTATLSELANPWALAFDARGNLFVANLTAGTVSEFTPAVRPMAGGVVVRTAQPDQPISVGAAAAGVALSNAELAQIVTTASGALHFGDASQTGDITVAGDVTRHPGYDTLALQTRGRINTASGATLAVANLALQAGSGIGTTGPLAIDANTLAFASDRGPIRISDANPVTLTAVDALPHSSIPGDVFSSKVVGSVDTLLSSGGVSVSAPIYYQGQPLKEGDQLTLADGNRYQISYRGGSSGQDVTLTRKANSAPPVPPPGTSTVGVFDPVTATWHLKDSNGPSAPDVAAFAFGAPGWVALVGDWDGDGVATVGAFDPATATWYLRNRNGPGAPDITPFRYGAPGWIPVVGDWDGDGTTTIGVFDPATATWYLRNRNGPGAPDITPFRYGAPGWIPVVGDWDGDGVTTIGVFDPVGQFGQAPATWYLKNSNSPGAADIGPFAYGAAGWRPVAGDWDGNGTDTIAVLDPIGQFGQPPATWYLRNSNSSGAPDVAPFAYGAAGWQPQSGIWTFATRPLHVLGGSVLGGPAVNPLTPDTANALMAQALARLQQDGVAASVVARLGAVTVELGGLGRGVVAAADPQSGRVLLDPSAVGHGWFVDPTPLQDEEFVAGGAGPLTAVAGGPAEGRVDLLTALLQELGVAAGLDSATLHAAMAPGARNVAALDAFFAAVT
jgi:hypothetical protein